MVWGKEVPATVGVSPGATLGGKPKTVSASPGRRTLADELSPFTGARTPPFPGFEASCPGGFPPSSRMAQQSQLPQIPTPDVRNDSIVGIVEVYSARDVNVADGKLQVQSHSPTQAKEWLEWGAHHLLPVWQKVWRSRAGSPRRRVGLRG